MKKHLIILPAITVLLLSVLCIYCYQMINVPDCAMQIYRVGVSGYVAYEITESKKIKCIVGTGFCGYTNDYEAERKVPSYDKVVWEEERKLTLKERILFAKKLKIISKKEVYCYGIDTGISVELLLNNEVSISKLAVLDWDSPEFHRVCADEDVIRLFGDFATLIKPELLTIPEKRESVKKLFAWVYKFDGKIVPTTNTYSEFKLSDFTVNYW